MSIVLRILINAAALWVAVRLLPGLHLEGGDGQGSSLVALLAIALILGVVNVIVKPILQVLSLPLVIATLGLFLLIVNALVLWIVIAISGALGLGISSDGFGWTVLAALIVSIVSWALETIALRR